jgi:hypothetical protein
MPAQQRQATPASCQQQEPGMSTVSERPRNHHTSEFYPMTYDQSSIFLRRALLLDAVASGATGLLVIAAAGLLEGLLSLPAALLRGAGLVLVPYVAFVIWAGTRETISHPAVWAIIAANVVWAAASALLLMSGWVAPTAPGYAFVIGQAVVVALLGELQYLGLRRPLAAA